MQDDLKAQLVGTYCSCFNIQYNEIALFVSNIKSINTIEDLKSVFNIARILPETNKKGCIIVCILKNTKKYEWLVQV